MVSYVIAHGWYVSGEPEITVPEGLTLSFLADVDLAGLHHVQVAQVIAGGVAAATTYKAGDPLPNYQFSIFEDDMVARLMQLNVHDLDLWIIGPVEASALCTDVGGACTQDRHVCEGGLLTIAQEKKVDHLHFLSCRVDNAEGHGPWEGDVNLHDGLGGKDSSYNDELLAFTVSFVTQDFATQRAIWESLDYQKKVERTADKEIEEWAQVYEAVRAFEAGEATFVPYLASLSGPVKERLFREHPDIAASVRTSLGPETISQYAQYADGFLAMAPADQAAAWGGLDAAVRETLLLDPRMGDWASANAARGYLPYLSPAQFRGVCAKLTPGALALVLADPDAAAKYAG